MAGQTLSPERLASIEPHVAAMVDPRANCLGTIGYRREMAGLLARRAIEAAMRGG
jgi:CO/xanthine dehydrogenase FAD-binding subunit